MTNENLDDTLDCIRRVEEIKKGERKVQFLHYVHCIESVREYKL